MKNRYRGLTIVIALAGVLMLAQLGAVEGVRAPGAEAQIGFGNRAVTYVEGCA